MNSFNLNTYIKAHLNIKHFYYKYRYKKQISIFKVVTLILPEHFFQVSIGFI
jgi:hypothetical protein